jgi:hypothetical protein
MNFLISESFTSSLVHLTGDEQKAVKTTAFDLQMNPTNPGDDFPQARQDGRQGFLVGSGGLQAKC